MLFTEKSYVAKTFDCVLLRSRVIHELRDIIFRYKSIWRVSSFSFESDERPRITEKLGDQLPIRMRILYELSFILLVVYQKELDRAFLISSPWDRITMHRLWDIYLLLSEIIAAEAVITRIYIHIPWCKVTALVERAWDSLVRDII